MTTRRDARARSPCLSLGLQSCSCVVTHTQGRATERYACAWTTNVGHRPVVDKGSWGQPGNFGNILGVNPSTSSERMMKCNALRYCDRMNDDMPWFCFIAFVCWRLKFDNVGAGQIVDTPCVLTYCWATQGNTVRRCMFTPPLSYMLLFHLWFVLGVS